MTGELAPADAAPRKCQLHRYHWPRPLVIVRHHVQPLGMGGPDEASNWLDACDTGHRNIHTLMGPAANGRAMPAGGTRAERAAAVEGLRRWIASGRPGNPHAAYGVVRAAA